MVDAKQWLNGEYGSPIALGCELDKYGELKGLIAECESGGRPRACPIIAALSRE